MGNSVQFIDEDSDISRCAPPRPFNPTLSAARYRQGPMTTLTVWNRKCDAPGRVAACTTPMDASRLVLRSQRAATINAVEETFFAEEKAGLLYSYLVLGLRFRARDHGPWF